MSEELKPCPFCGSNIIDLDYGYGEYYAQCADCKVIIYRTTSEEVVDAWNERSENEKF